MIHTATLLHDDVVDESSLRRGHATANALFGNAASVLVGDFLYSRAFQLIVSVDSMRALRILSDATEGKPTLRLIRAMQVGSAADAALIRDARERGRLDDFKPVVEVLARTDALDYAHRCAQAESAHASACLEALADSPARQTLLKLAAFAVERTY
jgi:geranylgeranyl pyrophosphate synthase